MPSPTAQADTVAIVQGLRRMVQALHSFSKDIYRSYGLTAPQLWALKTLQREGPLNAGRLARALAVHQSSASILVNRLERRGLVRRARGSSDGRVVQVALTSRGAALAQRAPEPAQGRLLHGLESMSRAQVRRLRQSIERLVGAMEATNLDARFFFSES